MTIVKKVTILFNVISLIISLCNSTNAETIPPSVLTRTKSGVVQITTFDNMGRRTGIGSGFFMANNQVASNVHVILNSVDAVIKLSNGDILKANKILGYNKDLDLVILDVSNFYGKRATLSISKNKPIVGEPVFVVSSPLGFEKTVSTGIISAIRDIQPFGEVYQITCPISQGSSGGPVVNMKGEVIGVVSFFVKDGQNINFAIPAKNLLNIQKSLSITIREFNINLKDSQLVAIDKQYDIRSGFKDTEWGTYLSTLQKAQPMLEYHNSLGDYKYYTVPKYSDVISGMRFDLIEYMFNQDNMFGGVTLMTKPYNPYSAILDYRMFINKIFNKYGKPKVSGYLKDSNTRNETKRLATSIWELEENIYIEANIEIFDDSPRSKYSIYVAIINKNYLSKHIETRKHELEF